MDIFNRNKVSQLERDNEVLEREVSELHSRVLELSLDSDREALRADELHKVCRIFIEELDGELEILDRFRRRLQSALREAWSTEAFEVLEDIRYLIEKIEKGGQENA